MSKANLIIEEVNKVIIGKEKVIREVWMTILSGGHVLLEDVPGVGKTTMALAFSKALGLSYRRIQFSLFRLITENGNTGIRENTAPIGHKKRQKNLGSNAIPAVTNKKRPVPIRLSAIFN